MRDHIEFAPCGCGIGKPIGAINPSRVVRPMRVWDWWRYRHHEPLVIVRPMRVGIGVSVIAP